MRILVKSAAAVLLGTAAVVAFAAAPAQASPPVKILVAKQLTTTVDGGCPPKCLT